MKKKADVKISLHFLVGLIFSVVLILLVLGGVKRLSEIIDPHYERDVIDNWIEDIDLINQDSEIYITELLSIKEVSGEYLFFIFQQTSKSLIGVNPDTGVTLNKPSKCSRNSCICAFSTESNEFEYCKTLGADQISFFRTPYDLEDYFVIANSNVDIEDDASKSKIVVSNNVFVYRNGKKITFCFNVENQKCTS